MRRLLCERMAYCRWMKQITRREKEGDIDCVWGVSRSTHMNAEDSVYVGEVWWKLGCRVASVTEYSCLTRMSFTNSLSSVFCLCLYVFTVGWWAASRAEVGLHRLAQVNTTSPPPLLQFWCSGDDKENVLLQPDMVLSVQSEKHQTLKQGCADLCCSKREAVKEIRS